MVLFSHTDDTLGKSLMIILRFPNSALGVFDYLFCIYRDTYFNHIGNRLFEFKKNSLIIHLCCWLYVDRFIANVLRVTKQEAGRLREPTCLFIRFREGVNL